MGGSGVTIDLEFIASGCNIKAGALDFKDGLTVFASGQNLFYSQSLCKHQNIDDHTNVRNVVGTTDNVAGPSNPSNAKTPMATKTGECGYTILPTIGNKHTDIIKQVKIVQVTPVCIVITCGADGRIVVWKEWEPHLIIENALPILGISAVSIDQDEWILGSFDGDGFVQSFKLNFRLMIHEKAGKRFAFGHYRKVTSLELINIFGRVIVTIGTSDCLLRVGQLDADLQWKEHLELSGHSNWITSQSWSPATCQDGVCFLATAGPDKTIRVWKLYSQAAPGKDGQTKKNQGLQELVPKKNYFDDCIIECEAILYGHEGAVNFVSWMTMEKESQIPASSLSFLRLVSSSDDHSVIVWRPDQDIWPSESQLGGLAGINDTKSFYSVFIHARNDGTMHLITHNSTGSINRWVRKYSVSIEEDGGAYNFGDWKMQRPITGHFNGVECLSWASNGEYFLSASKDQTTRLWKPILGRIGGEKGYWREMERPQVHGYDLKCIAMIPNKDAFLSGADEKVLRVFKQGDSKAMGVQVPTLGLSNKQVYNGSQSSKVLGSKEKDDDGDDDQEGNVKDKDSSEQHNSNFNDGDDDFDEDRNVRLWPEVDKLYAHGHELFSLAVSHDGNFAVSGCKANNVMDAGPKLWYCDKEQQGEDGRWKLGKVDELVGPTLTMTAISFSPNDQFVLVCSRDRSWTVYKLMIGVQDEGDVKMDNYVNLKPVKRQGEAHGRVIWSAVWIDNETFMTGSRDGMVKTWCRIGVNEWIERTAWTMNFGISVTFIDVTTFPTQSKDSPLLMVMAVGDETGTVHLAVQSKLYGWERPENALWSAGSKSITCLRWQPCLVDDGVAMRRLAVSSEDRSVRIYQIRFDW